MGKKQLYILLGFMCVALGMLGVFLPLLPTTPFLLLAMWFFIRSSKRYLKWMLKNKYLSPYIYGYLSNRGMPVKVKMRTIIILWVTILISALFVVTNIYIRILLLIIATFVTIHILSIKSSYED